MINKQQSLNKSQTLVKHSRGPPKWWTGPGNTGLQLLVGDGLIGAFLDEATTIDMIEIRRIIFRMLGLNHLVFFLDACCNHVQLTDEMDGMNNVEFVNVLGTMKAAKRQAFNDTNVRRLLWFALDCGLELEATTRHMTLFGFCQRGINHFTLCRSYQMTFGRCATVATVEMLTKLRVRGVHLNGIVTNAVLDYTTFNAEPIFYENNPILQPRTRLDVTDSGSAVWFEILDMLFAYHQNASPPESSSLHIMAKCLCGSVGMNIMRLLIKADKNDTQRRMLPYLLGKHDLSSGAIITAFYLSTDDFHYLFACADLCKRHKDWSGTCIKIINLFANCNNFVANVRQLPGMNQYTTIADIADYISVNLQLDRPQVCKIGSKLALIVVRHTTFATESSIDWVFEWMMNDEQHIALVFAERLFQTRTVAQRAVIYKRFLASDKRSCRAEIIYYLMHGKDAFGTYEHSEHCSLSLVINMLEHKFEDNTVDHIISAAHTQDVDRFDDVPYLILELCKFALR
ncbi:hypothetical protein JKY72_01175, partial [Candidatus Gracilibacteria bacterium]|nr:hypothetical protein [Candidatus Gracilibacteria bacterium]